MPSINISGITLILTLWSSSDKKTSSGGDPSDMIKSESDNILVHKALRSDILPAVFFNVINQNNRTPDEPEI